MSLPKIEDVILSGALTPLMKKIRAGIAPEFFEDEHRGLIYTKMVRFYDEMALPISLEALDAWSDTLNAEQRLTIEPILRRLSPTIDIPLVHTQLEVFVQDFKERETKAVANLATELRKGRDEDVREKMLIKLMGIRDRGKDKSIFEEFTSIESYAKMEAYIEAQSKKEAGVLTGIKNLDEHLNGGRAGELWVYYAASKHGKSTMLRNHCHHAAVEQKKNVIIFSAELGTDLMRQNIAAIHAFKKFGLKDFNTRSIRTGTARPEHLKIFLEAYKDLTDNEGGKYGRIFFEKVDGSKTIRDLHVRAEEINRFAPVSAVFIDYFDRLASLKKGPDNYLSKGETFIYGKGDFALGFNNGEGIMVCTAHQMNKEGKIKAAKRNGIYLLEDASNTPDAYRSPDVVISLFPCAELEQEKQGLELPEIIKHTVRMTVLANRGGEAYPHLPAFEIESQLGMSVLRSFDSAEAVVENTTFASMADDAFSDLLGDKPEKKS